MPLFADVVGSTTEPFRHHVDRRWILAYSAGIGDASPSAFSQDAVAHPMFPVCPEWPVVLGVRQAGLVAEISRDAIIPPRLLRARTGTTP